MDLSPLQKYSEMCSATKSLTKMWINFTHFSRITLSKEIYKSNVAHPHLAFQNQKYKIELENLFSDLSLLDKFT